MNDNCGCVNGQCANTGNGCACNLFWSGDRCDDNSLATHPLVYIYYVGWSVFWVVFVTFQADQVRHEWRRRRWTVFTSLLCINCCLSAVRISTFILGYRVPGEFGSTPVILFYMFTVNSKLVMLYFLRNVSAVVRNPRLWNVAGTVLSLIALVSLGVPTLRTLYMSLASAVDMVILSPLTIWRVARMRKAVRNSSVPDILNIQGRCTRFLWYFVPHSILAPIFLFAVIFGDIEPSPAIVVVHSWEAMNSVLLLLAELAFCGSDSLSVRFRRHIQAFLGHDTAEKSGLASPPARRTSAMPPLSPDGKANQFAEPSTEEAAASI